MPLCFYRQMDIYDTLHFQNINQDQFTATFSPDFYCAYMIHFPEQCFVADAYKRLAGYMIGKDEASGADYHVHVSAVTVAPESRRQHISQNLMEQLEKVGNRFGCRFCDLFVREKNDAANAFYEKLNYIIFRTVKDYYAGEESAYDRRKPLNIDKTKQSVINAGSTIRKWIDYEW